MLLFFVLIVLFFTSLNFSFLFPNDSVNNSNQNFTNDSVEQIFNYSGVVEEGLIDNSGKPEVIGGSGGGGGGGGGGDGNGELVIVEELIEINSVEINGPILTLQILKTSGNEEVVNLRVVLEDESGIIEEDFEKQVSILTSESEMVRISLVGCSLANVAKVFVYPIFAEGVMGVSHTVKELDEPIFLEISDSLKAFAQARGIDIGSAIYFFILDYNNYLNYNETLKSEFNVIVPQASMMNKYTNPGLNSWDFNRSEGVLNFALINGLKVHGHPIVWAHNPPNYLNWEIRTLPTPAELEIILENHINEMITYHVENFPEVVDTWVVVNEALANDQNDGFDTGLGFTLRDNKQIVGTDNNYWVEVPDYVSKSFKWAREAADDAGDSEVKLFYNENHVGLLGQEEKFEALVNMLEYLKSEDVPLDGVGFQMHMKTNSLFDKQTLIDRFKIIGELGFEVQITELDVQIVGEVSDVEREKQAQIYRESLEACLESGYCTGFTMWGFTDKHSPYSSYIFDEDYNRKLAYSGLVDGFLGE